MAKLFFYYSSMNAGKSTTLLQSAHNYRERGMRPLLFTPQLDTRAGKGWIASRIGLKSEALAFSPVDDLFKLTKTQEGIDCVLIFSANSFFATSFVSNRARSNSNVTEAE